MVNNKVSNKNKTNSIKDKHKAWLIFGVSIVVLLVLVLVIYSPVKEAVIGEAFVKGPGLPETGVPEVPQPSPLPINSGDMISLNSPAWKNNYCAAEQLNNHIIHCNRNSVGLWEKYFIEEVGGDGVINSGDTIKIKSYVWNKYCLAKLELGDKIYCDQESLGSGQGEFTIKEVGGDGEIKAGDTITLMKKVTAKFCAADCETEDCVSTVPDTDNPVVRCNRNSIGEWEKFIIGKIIIPPCVTPSCNPYNGQQKCNGAGQWVNCPENQICQPATGQCSCISTTELCSNNVDDDCDGKVDEGCPFGYLDSASCEEGLKGWARDSRNIDGTQIINDNPDTSSTLDIRFYLLSAENSEVASTTANEIRSDFGKHGFGEVTKIPVVIPGASVGQSHTIKAFGINNGISSSGNPQLTQDKIITINQEVCDGKDNNCDGLVDEEEEICSTTTNCGTFGNACALGQICQSGACVNIGPLIIEYNFIEGLGTMIMDSSGNGNEGTLTGTSWQTKDCIKDSCLVFNGNAYVVTNNPISTSSFSGISVMAWVKTTDTSGTKAIIQSPNTNGFVCYLSRFDSGKLLCIFDGASGNNNMNQDSITSINDGVWHQIVGTNDGTTTKIYVDGVLENTYAETLVKGSAATYIGRLSDGTKGFIGAMDEVKIYNTDLTAEAITTIYNAEACTDSDVDETHPDGKNSGVKGTVTAKGISVTDYCPFTSGLIEYYCIGDIGRGIRTPCSCIDGACVTSSDADGDGIPDNYDDCSNVGGNIFYPKEYAPTGVTVADVYSTGNTAFNFKGCLKGDINGDRIISAIDFSDWVNTYQIKKTETNLVSRADLNQDGSISAIDASDQVNQYQLLK